MKTTLRRFSAALVASLALVSAAPGEARQEYLRASSWQDDVIYLVMTDRFHNGDRQNDHDADPKDPFAYHGGDLAGVIQKLDYLKDLGVTALWITPHVDNQNGRFMGKYTGYHGYWIQDFDRVDEHFGDEATVKRLVDEAHKRGLKVLFDVVVNHPGYDAPMVKDPKFADWFHKNGDITNWNDPYQNENYKLVGLPDFNSEHAAVLDFMVEKWGGWIARTGVDGFRLDTVRHVSIPFWKRFNAAMHQKGGKNFFLVGEVSWEQAHQVAPYMRESGIDSAFDFPLYYTLTDVFARGKSMKLLGEQLANDRLYPDAQKLSPFVENHDAPRFLHIAKGDERKLRLALAFVLTIRGIPTVYYGTEVAMTGAGDPDNRRDMAWGTNPAMHAYTRKLLHLRRDHAALRRGEQTELFRDDTVYGYMRHDRREQVLVFLNNGHQARTVSVTLPVKSPVHDGVFTNRLGGDRVNLAHRKLTLTLRPNEAKVLTSR